MASIKFSMKIVNETGHDKTIVLINCKCGCPNWNREETICKYCDHYKFGRHNTTMTITPGKIN